MQLAPGVHVAITDRNGGVSAPPYGTRNLGGMVGDDPAAVRANREGVAAELGVRAIVFMR
ncbi:laccase domain-containing protein, partial [Nonomuraea fuscirosea]